MILYDSPYYGVTAIGDSIMHYQVKGAKHGVRRYQNEDGSLTPLGREHYGVGEGRDKARTDKDRPSEKSGRYPSGSKSASKKRTPKAETEKSKAAENAQKSELDNALTYYSRSDATDDDVRRGQELENRITKLVDASSSEGYTSKRLGKSFAKLRASYEDYFKRDKEYNSINPPPKKTMGFNANKKYNKAMNEWTAAKKKDPELNRLAKESDDRLSEYAGAMLKEIGYADTESNRKRMRKLVSMYESGGLSH